MSCYVVGVDPSLTNTAVAIWSPEDKAPADVRCFPSKNVGRLAFQRMQRCESILSRIMGFLEGKEIAAVFLEGYSFASNDSGSKFTTEFGGLLRWHLMDTVEHGNLLYEVAPTTLKKFITGSGSGSKQGVIAHVSANYGVIFKTDDEYDAWSLCRLGAAALKWIPTNNKAQAESVERVLEGPKDKPRKAKKPVE